jgi:hypothetical protein
MPMSDTKLKQIMYTLGEIAGVVFPTADIPPGIRATLLSRPCDGLRMMREHDNYKNVRIDQLTALLDSVPADFNVPADRLSDDLKERFWAGFLGD